MAGVSGFAEGLNLVEDTTGGTVTSITATAPIVVTPSPLTTTGVISFTTPGSTTQVMFNDAGALAGDAGLTYNKTTDTLTVVGSVLIGTGGTLSSFSANTIRVGAADSATPTAQTVSTQNVVAGTSNTAGVNLTFKGSMGTGTGAGGSLLFQVAPAGTTGTSQNALATLLTLASTGAISATLGTITASAPFAVSETWNNSGVTFKAMTVSVTDQAANAGSAAGSLLFELLCGTAGTTSVFSVNKIGTVTASVSGNGYALGTVAGISANSNNLVLQGNSAFTASVFSTAFRLLSTADLVWSSTTSFGGTNDLTLRQRAAANLALGAADAASPVAQTISVQNVVAGTSNVAGANFTISGSQGTGTGAGGSIILQTAAAGSSGSSVNALAIGFRLDQLKNVVLNNAAIATNATDGFLYVAACAGTPTGAPTAYTGRVPIVVDSTNNKLYFYSNSAWRDAGP